MPLHSYRVSHTTSYRYTNPVSVCHNALTLAPRDDSRLEITHQHVEVEPEPRTIRVRQDLFGNIKHRFSLEFEHRRLIITSRFTATVHAQPEVEFRESPTCGEIRDRIARREDARWLSASICLGASPRVQNLPAFHEYATKSLEPDRPILEASRELCHRIYDDFSYDKEATAVDTMAAQAYRTRAGVCQDFAQVAIGCLRSHGIPARYVSGYLRTIPPKGKPRLVGADQSHAWFSVFAGESIGWVDFDPTNDCLSQTDHIPIAVGRDYSDVVPLKGVFLGGGNTVLNVKVDVRPLDET